MPACVLKYAQITRQMKNAAEVKAIEMTGSAVTGSVEGAFGCCIVTNLLIAGAMTQVWSFLSSLQVVQYITLFDSKTPGNVVSFIDYFDSVTKLEIIDSEDI